MPRPNSFGRALSGVTRRRSHAQTSLGVAPNRIIGLVVACIGMDAPDVTIVVPAYNEEGSLGPTVRAVAGKLRELGAVINKTKV